MKYIISSIRIMIFFTLLLGLAYPLFITGIGQSLFKEKANGSLVQKDNQIVGSELIAQNFEKPEYFSSRPSVISFNPLPSGGSNLGATSEALKNAVSERRTKLMESNPDMQQPPKLLLFASASGLDPHIDLESALYQVDRIAKFRSLDKEAVNKIIYANIKQRQFGIFGEETVNVLVLNLALDRFHGSVNTQVSSLVN